MMTTVTSRLAKEGRMRGTPKAMPNPADNLTDREKQLLRGILADKTYSEIAHDMKLSHETIKSYSARIRGKLGISTKIGLALWASKYLK